MQSNQRLILAKGPMPVILIAAVVQGWALYALHQSIKQQFWPATNSAWLLALYALAVFVPLTVQLLSDQARSKTLWIALAFVGAIYFYFGYYSGANIYPNAPKRLNESGDFLLLPIILGLLWLLLMPFVQVRMATGGFRYAMLFTTAWRNKLLLAEAVAFTGLFWLLLLLCATLFKMLGIEFFKELFEEPIFIYPITTLVFGIALHLIGSVDRITVAILEQVLSVLKWLAIVAGLILALFTCALVFKLPGLVIAEQKFIGAAWLLWLVAVNVLLINAAYRDGEVAQPYPAWLAFALRCVVPLTVIISATALYALIVRARHYGITVERFWAFVVAGTALSYSIGYSAAAFGKGKWLEGVARVNIAVAVVLIAIIALTLTPILSPHRIAANSQYRAAQETVAVESTTDRSSALYYLRFEAGRYGMERLKDLTQLQNHPEAERIRRVSSKLLARQSRYEQLLMDPVATLARLVMFPSGREIDADLRAQLTERIGTLAIRNVDVEEVPLAGLFIDLNADHVDEFVLLHQGGGNLYQRTRDGWRLGGPFFPNRSKAVDFESQIESVKQGKVSSKVPEWQILRVGEIEYRTNAN
jgi:hypothetical protein